jgi:uncharacterized protein
MNRREMLLRSGAVAATLGLSRLPLGWTAPVDRDKKQRVLMFTKSQGFEHPVVKRGPNGELSLAERIVTDLGKKHGFEVVCSKDGREFIPENVSKYDAFVFETTGDLDKDGTDRTPPMPPEGKKTLLDAIANGKGFVGCHCASDTFHSKGERTQNQHGDEIDPYIRMLGGEFFTHGSQQKARMIVADANFPGAKSLKDFDMTEEWYDLKNFTPDLHVILVQDTEGMKEKFYHRPNYPATWARMHHKGRVFYTSMGHREDVWEGQTMQDVLMGGLAWALGNVDADVTPNMKQATPQADELKRS